MPLFRNYVLFISLALFLFNLLSTALIAQDFGKYLKAVLEPTSWRKLDCNPEQTIPLVDLKTNELRVALAQIRHGNFPLTHPALSHKDMNLVDTHVYEHLNQPSPAYLLVAQMRSNVPPKSLRKRLFRRLDYLFREKYFETSLAYKRQRQYNRTVKEQKNKLALTHEFAAFRVTSHRSRVSSTECRNGWFFYSNPAAKHPFKTRRGQFTLVWYITKHEREILPFLKQWSQVRAAIDFTDSIHDCFEKGQLLPLVSILADRENGTWTTLKAASGGFATGAVVTHSIKHLVGAERPNGHGFVSFPSGHTNSAATAAGSIGYLHRKSRVPLFILAIMTGRSRVRSQHHTVFDTFVGGVLGYYIGRHVAKRMKDVDRDSGQAKTVNLHTIRF